MSPEELNFIHKHLAAYGVTALVAVALVYLVCRYALGAYLTEKGKNLATKEDLAALTTIVEDVKAPYTQLQEELKARHQLRVAAIDRRLQAHQEAFTLWREVMSNVHSERIGPTVLKCQDWWERNCLYLEPEVRESFVKSYSAAHGHHVYLLNRSDAELAKANWNDITQFPTVLFKAIKLPPLSELEKAVMTGSATAQS
jgi:hypothetical protein